MSKGEFEILIREIASAVFRVGETVKHQRLKTELTNAAVAAVADWGEAEAAEKSLDRLSRVVSLSKMVGETSEVNASVLLREIGNAKIALASERNSGKMVDISRMFEFQTGESLIRKQSGNVENNPEISPEGSLETLDNLRNRARIEPKSPEAESLKAAVLDYIRKHSDGCRIEQLINEFPSVSKKIIQTCVWDLIEDGVVEDRSLISGTIRNSASDSEDNPEASDRAVSNSPTDSRESETEGRKAAILEYIRRFPDGCQTRQLAGEFPDVSDRTIRNYVRALIDEGLVEKTGSQSGPQSYIRPRAVSFVTKPRF